MEANPATPPFFQAAASNLAPSEEPMSTERAIEVVSVERIDGTEIIVEFSDATFARYTTERLLQMAPEREPANGREWKPSK